MKKYAEKKFSPFSFPHFRHQQQRRNIYFMTKGQNSPNIIKNFVKFNMKKIIRRVFLTPRMNIGWTIIQASNGLNMMRITIIYNFISNGIT